MNLINSIILQLDVVLYLPTPIHLKSIPDGTMQELRGFVYFIAGNTFQNRRVSSPAPVTRVYPSGLQLK